jgi:hypothetical protein
MLRWAAVAGILACAAASPSAAADRITQFAQEIGVDGDGALDIEETIAVLVDGTAIKHGLLRDFPIRRNTPTGTVNASLDITRVLRDGRREPFVIQPESRFSRVRIGDPDVLVDSGPHTYQLTYRRDRVLYVGRDAGVLHWDVTGNGWMFPIDEAAASIRLPRGAHIIRTDFHTGPAEATEKNAAVVQDSERLVRFHTTAPLRTAEGLTVIVCFTFESGTEWTAAIADSERYVELLCGSRAARRGTAGVSRA